MKFLYLKGMDIFGPLEAEQLAKENCFSADLLVCPEENAEQEAAWKPASRYEEFKNILEQKVLHIEETNQIVNKNFADTPKISDAPISESDTNISQDLPPLADTGTETSTTETNTFSFEQVMSDMSSSKEEGSSEVFEEDVKDHTFRVANKEDNILEDLPAHSLLGAEADKEPGENITSGKSNAEMQDLVPTDKQNNGQATDDAVDKKDFLEISNNKIISSSDGRVKKRNSNDLLFVLSFIVLMVVAIALCMAFWNMMNDDKDAGAEVSQNANIEQPLNNEEANTLVADTTPKINEDENINEVAVQTPAVPLETQVIEVVKNTQLTSKKKTVGEYLDKVYGAEYQHSWSAKPFTDKVYIVEFFASQVRREPFVYLFRVDLDKKKITGALNNMTLDLLA